MSYDQKTEAMASLTDASRLNSIMGDAMDARQYLISEGYTDSEASQILEFAEIEEDDIC